MFGTGHKIRSPKMHGEKTPKVRNSAEVLRITGENAQFFANNGFPSMTLKTEKGEEHFKKISFRRAFPFELLWEYISVLDEDEFEIGIIYNIEDVAEAKEIIVTELSRRYYEPHIAAVISLKERYGFSYWSVKLTDGRTVQFTMQDTFRNIIRAGDDKAIMLDVDGNRFVIESIKALDKRSYKRIELYL